MRIVHWLFLVSVALFVLGVGFVIAGARSARAAVVVDAPAIAPVGTVKQIMKGITGPAADVIFNSVSTSVTAKGVEEKAPHTDAEWEVVGNAAAAIAESGNLMLVGSRAIDKGDWTKMSQAMIDAGKGVLKAVEAKSADQILASGEAVNTSCDTCHAKYRRN